MSIHVRSKRRKLENIKKEFGNAVIIDVTSKASEPWIRLSPFYPHGNIPVPFCKEVTAQSVEGIWQGLKVFEKKGIDTTKFDITNMKGIKRTVKTHGKILGHQAGVDSKKLLDYKKARYKIYLPAYKWVLDKEKDLVKELKRLAREHSVVLLDFEKNGDPDDLSAPLSHAHLIRLYARNKYPVSK